MLVLRNVPVAILFWRAYLRMTGSLFDSLSDLKMSVARKLKVQPQTRTFHATMLVTRVEDWWVEAESLDEAEALLAACQGHRAAVGELVHVELDAVHADEDT